MFPRPKLTFEQLKNSLESSPCGELFLEEVLQMDDSEFLKAVDYRFEAKSAKTRVSLLHFVAEKTIASRAETSADKIKLMKRIFNVKKEAVDWKDGRFGYAPLFRAALVKDTAVIKFLCSECKADVKITTPGGATPLHFLFWKYTLPYSVNIDEYLDAAKFLILQGVNVLSKHNKNVDFIQSIDANKEITEEDKDILIKNLAYYIKDFARSYLKNYEKLDLPMEVDRGHD